jgi:phosphoribosylanthranilate isomerase
MAARALPPANRRPWLKVCGLRQIDQAVHVAAGGADAIGVIAVPHSPRWLEPADRPALFSAIAREAPACLGVLVVADPEDGDLPQLGPQAGHHVLQLHGSESPERCAELRQVLGPDLALWKALRIRSPEDLQLAHHYAEVVEALLLDAWVPDQLGGTGHRIPVEWLTGFQPALPWWLAGGLNPERAPLALKALAAAPPAGLDVSSGVELAPGVKDLDRVDQLLAAMTPFRQDHCS